MLKPILERAALALVSALFLSAFAPAFGADSESEARRLSVYWNGVLAARVAKIVDARTDALRRCRAAGSAEQGVTERIGILRSAPGSSASRVLALMESYQLTHELLEGGRSRCASAIRAADLRIADSERERFRFLRHAPEATETGVILKELDPWCAIDPRPNFEGGRDGNPCFAGEGPILRAMIDPTPAAGEDPFARAGAEIDELVHRFRLAVERGRTGETIDLFSLMPSSMTESLEGRRLGLAAWAYLHAAATFRLGWIDGFADRFWSEPLRRGATPSEAYAAVVRWMNRKHVFAGHLHFAHSKGLRFRFGTIEATEWNRHDLVSAFLACEFRLRGEGALARILPPALGVAYEGKDLVSHLREGAGLEASLRNFGTDTGRYARGTRLGLRFCRAR